MSAATDLFLARANLQLPDFPVKNSSGSAIPVNSLVALDANAVSAATPTVGVVIAPTGNGTLPFGVAVETIPAGAQGRVQVLDGTAVWCIVDGAGNITQGTQVMPSATVAGAVMTWTTGITKSLVGVALSSTTATADPVLVMLQKRGPC